MSKPQKNDQVIAINSDNQVITGTAQAVGEHTTLVRTADGSSHLVLTQDAKKTP